jgi:hypothetical protein
MKESVSFLAMELNQTNGTWKAGRALLTGILLAATLASAQTPPPNDNFADRILAAGTAVTMSGNLTGSTIETAEADALGPWDAGAGSIWWEWTAPVSSIVTIQLMRDYSWWDSTNTAFFVYSGDALSNLSQLDSNSFDSPAGRYIRFSATQGVNYQIRAAGHWPGFFSLRLRSTNAPVFVAQPQDSVVSAHASAFFCAQATGPRPWLRATTAYQWYFNDNPISGQEYPSLLVHDVSTNNAGTYFVTASNVDGISKSASATLIVTNSDPVPYLAALRPTNSSTLSFSVLGEVGRWYEYETSTNLVCWTNATWFGASNSQTLIFIPRMGPNQFVRASLNVPTDICVGQLKQIRWGQYVRGIEDRESAWEYEPLELIKYYVPLQGAGNITPCPEWGYYSPGAIINDNPRCSVGSHGHVLTDGYVY